MKKKLLVILSYILFILNSTSFANENNNILKIGLLAPFSGEYKELGNSMMFSIQLALSEINDDKIIIIPRDTGSNDNKKLNNSINEIRKEGAKIIIGPIDSLDFEEVNKHKDLIFISPSNMHPEINNNIISIGISLESQLLSLNKLLSKKKRKRTILLIPNNNYTDFIDKKIKDLNLKYFKIFKYSSDPKVLTGEMQKITNYSQRKQNLEIRKKILEKKIIENENDFLSQRELKLLDQKYTLGEVNFDSVVVLDFGNNLKSVLTSLVFSDVNQDKVLFATLNQWFDKSIFYENSLKSLYYPSINYDNFNNYNKKYIATFNTQPNEITILAYDAVGLIYYIWKKNKKIDSIKDFLIKDKIKGKIGTFSFSGNKVSQDLNIYIIEDKKIVKF